MPLKPSSLSFNTYVSPYGPFTVQASQAGIVALAFDDQPMEGKRGATALTNLAATQVQEYLAGKRFDFTVPLDMQGTDFQKAVWREAVAIPYGQVVMARDLAARLGRPSSYRSIGKALGECRLAPLVPVHRVEQPQANAHHALYFAFRTLEKQTQSRL